jgi:hypothetical protein
MYSTLKFEMLELQIPILKIFQKGPSNNTIYIFKCLCLFFTKICDQIWNLFELPYFHKYFQLKSQLPFSFAQPKYLYHFPPFSSLLPPANPLCSSSPLFLITFKSLSYNQGIVDSLRWASKTMECAKLKWSRWLEKKAWIAYKKFSTNL